MPNAAALPSGPGRPRIWQLSRYALDPIGYVEECAASFGPLFTLDMPIFGTFVAVVAPDDVDAVLARVPDRFPGEADTSPLTPLMGEHAMMFATGAAHRAQRRALLPAFRAGLADRWREQIATLAEHELARLPSGTPVATLPAMRRLTLEVVCRLVFGATGEPHATRLREELAPGYDARLVPMLLWPTLWRRDGRLNPSRQLKRRRDAANRLILDLIARRRAEAGRNGRVDALSLLLAARDEHGRPLSDAHVRDQLIGLVLLGHEPSATGLAWMLERLSRAPAAAARLVAALAAGHAELLDAAVRETLRLRPALLDAPRTTAEEIELSGRRIPSGTLLTPMLAVVHRRADVWEQPLAFVPERFLAEDLPSHAYAPFGGGARRCIAASLVTLLMRVVLETTLRHVTLVPAPGPEETPQLAGIALVPSRGARVVVLRRHSVRSSSTSGGRVVSQLG